MNKYQIKKSAWETKHGYGKKNVVKLFTPVYIWGDKFWASDVALFGYSNCEKIAFEKYRKLGLTRADIKSWSEIGI